MAHQYTPHSSKMCTGTQFDTTKMIYEAIYISCFSIAFARKSINNTVARESARAASEVKPVSQQMYIKKLIKLKMKDWDKRDKKANKFKRTPSKQWMYSNPVEWKKFTRHVEIARKLEMPQQQQEDSLIKQLTSPKFPSANENPDQSPDTEIVKITTVIEAVRQKRRRSAPTSTREETNGAERAIGKKRSKRSLREPDYARRAREEIRSVMNERSRYPKRRYRDPRREAPPAKKRASGDLKAASAMPSAVFYKRIWEYINGTRPHSDITRDYDPSEDNPKKEKSACTDRDRVAASQSRVNESRATSPGGVKPERAFYERIWDIINATKLTRGDPKARSKRNATASAECAQEREADPDENRRATNEGAALLDITDAVDPPEGPDPGDYVSNFWIVANKTQWQPERPAPVNIVQLGSISSPSANVASASEVNDLNKFPDKIQSSADHLASGDSADETRNQSQAITEPGPPYSSKEEDFIVPSSTARALQMAHSVSYSADTTPIYDPANIPYVEVPDYSDKRENTLAKNNQSSAAGKYKEYDDNDYVDPEQLRSVERFSSSSSPGAEVEHNIQATNDGPATPLNVSRSNCAENKDSAECVTQYSVENVNLNNNTEDVVPRSPEDSAERENSTEEFVHFDINEYRKPFEFEFIGKDPVFKSSRAASSEGTREENTKHVKENSGSGESKYEEYATYPKEKYSGENSTYKKEPEEYEKYFTYPREKDVKRNNENNSNDAEKSEEETYPREKYTKYENEKIPKEESEEPEEYAKYFAYPKEKDVKRNNEDNSNAEKSEEETYPREKYTKYENEKIPKEESKGPEEYEKYFAYPKEKNTEHDDEKRFNDSEKSEEYETYAAYPKEDAKREENPSPSEESEEYETHATYEKEKNAPDAEEDPAGNEKSEEHEAYGTYATENDSDKKSLEHSGDETNATYPKEELYDYSAKSKDYQDNYYPISEEKDETREEANAEEGEKSRGISDKDQYDEKDFFKHIFGEDRNKESSDRIDTEREFLSRYFTEDVLRKMQDNSTAEEDKEKEESKNREEIHRTLSEILDKKDRYSRLDDNLDKMIEKGEAIPIRYNNFWSLEYHSPKNIEKKEREEEEEEA